MKVVDMNIKNIGNIKKGIYVLFVLFAMIAFMYALSNTFASTNTEKRTESDLKIWPSISVTTTSKQAALKTPKVNEKEKLYDFANLFTDEEETKLFADISTFIQYNNLDMVIVTINENNKSSAMAYADDFYDYNYFGIGDNHSGVLLLIDMDTRKVWISTTGSAISIYTDSDIDNILDKVTPNLTSKKYYQAAARFIAETSRYGNYPDTIDKLNYDVSVEESIEKLTISFVIAICISSVLVIVFIIVGIKKHRNVKIATQAKAYLKKDSINISTREDVFVNSHTSRIRRSHDDDFGGSSGGSSSHSSSSGTSHGGGGRSF